MLPVTELEESSFTYCVPANHNDMYTKLPHFSGTSVWMLTELGTNKMFSRWYW